MAGADDQEIGEVLMRGTTDGEKVETGPQT